MKQERSVGPVGSMIFCGCQKCRPRLRGSEFASKNTVGLDRVTKSQVFRNRQKVLNDGTFCYL